MKERLAYIGTGMVKRVYNQPGTSIIEYEVDGMVALKISDEGTGEQLTNRRHKHHVENPSPENEVEWGNLW